MAFKRLVVLACCCCVGAAFALEKKSVRLVAPAFTDAAAAGPEYAIQGEYVGDVTAADGTKRKLAVQVVALGSSAYKAVFLTGGLPNEGWDGAARLEVKGRTVERKTSFDGEYKGSTEKGDVLVGETAKGEKFELKKVFRSSPTMGMKPPDGAVMLFDGTDTGLLDRCAIDDRKLLRALVPVGGTSGYGPATKKKYQDFSMHIEFLIPFVPEGTIGERGNSGVYMQERYEIQIIDSFGSPLDPHECGGIYRQTAELINMTFPPLSWQTYEIDFHAAQFDADGKKTQNATVSVTHNGVRVHANAEITNKTGAGKPEGPEPMSVMLQSHGYPVLFRNWWIVGK